MESGRRIGFKARIILISGFHYSGTILDEDISFIKIKDKFGSDVTLRKEDCQVLEVLQ